MEKYVLSVLVENHAGVLSRVSGLFSRRGYNIDSLTVCETADSNRSRMTIVVKGDEYILEQIEKQLSKLVEVISIEHCIPSETTQREMALFRAHIVDVSENSLIVEATGSEDKISSLIRLLEPYGILELLKSGLTAMDRGEKVMK